MNPNLKKSETIKRENKIHVAHVESYTGPIPHPSTLAGYEKICKGAADRIITMAEKQLEHRIQMEKLQLEEEYKLHQQQFEQYKKFNDRGQIFGFILFLIFILGSFSLLYSGKFVIGFTTLGTTILFGIISVVYKFKFDNIKKSNNIK